MAGEAKQIQVSKENIYTVPKNHVSITKLGQNNYLNKMTAKVQMKRM